ncbi:uncharacterized protein LOC142982978 [Anticarsia gemmatalis]|uniref:uncharacterized protein LOC142982978 n=1 Tax=Anticarsia gemmatalis TaxID=129554 RepID=UPI003F758444
MRHSQNIRKMLSQQKLVCNIRPIILIRFIFGHYQRQVEEASILGNVETVVIFLLLYLRVKILKHTVKDRGFDDVSPQYSPKKYVEMYEELVDALDDIILPLKWKSFSFTDERKRAELQMIIDVITDRPMAYLKWRLFPLSIKVYLSFFSLGIVHIIAIVQIMSYK